MRWYLERPVQVHLADNHGAPLREQAQAAALREGWQRLVGTGSSVARPARVFFDTTGNRESVIPLTQALGTESEAPSTGDVKEGYDVGYRLGNTGVTSGAVHSRCHSLPASRMGRQVLLSCGMRGEMQNWF